MARQTKTICRRFDSYRKAIACFGNSPTDFPIFGSQLGISERTARNHVSTIFSKLGVNERAQAIVRAREAGFGRKADR